MGKGQGYITRILNEISNPLNSRIPPGSGRSSPEEVTTMDLNGFARYLISRLSDLPDNSDYIYDLLVRRPEYRLLSKAELNALVIQHQEEINAYEQCVYNVWESYPEINYEQPTDADSHPIHRWGNCWGWSHFVINEGLEDEPEHYKGYLTLHEPLKLSPESFRGFLEALAAAGFHGALKVPGLGRESYAFSRFENFVIYSNKPEAIEMALDVAKKHFGDQLAATERGIDLNYPRSLSSTDAIAKALAFLKAKEPIPEELFRQHPWLREYQEASLLA
jgi:hypothetical protein